MNTARPIDMGKYGRRHAESGGLTSVALSPPEMLLLLSFFLAVFEGAARKWVFLGMPAAGYALYFSKDLAFAAALFLAKPREAFPLANSFRNWVGVGVALTLIGSVVAAFNELNLIGAVLTIRATVVLPVFAVIAMNRFRDIQSNRTMWLLALCGLANFALGTLQFSLPADHILNTYSDTSLDVVQIEESVRATGTFSYITGLSVMSTFAVLAGLSLMSEARAFSLGVGGIAVIGGIGCGLVSVSRAPILMAAVIILGWLLFSGFVQARLVQAVGSLCVIAVIINFTVGSDFLAKYTSVILNRNAEAQQNETLSSRTIEPLLETFDVMDAAPLGIGLGSEQVAGVWATTGKANFARFEAPWPRLVLETGILGALGFAITSIGTLLVLWTAAKNACCTAQRGIMVATLFTAASFFATNVIFNHISSGMLWPIIGLVLASAGDACGACKANEPVHE
jgi:hypothetical protein